MEDVNKYISTVGKNVEVAIDLIKFDVKKLFLYETQHFVHHSNGFFKQTCGDDLLVPIKLQKKICEKQGEKVLEIFRGEWMALSAKERQKKIEGLIIDK